jgi:hypothetical protein
MTASRLDLAKSGVGSSGELVPHPNVLLWFG